MTRIAVRLFGNYYRERRNEFSSLHTALVRADMYMSVETWLSIITLYTLILSLPTAAVFIILSRFGFGYFLVWDVLGRLPSITPIEILQLVAEFLLLVLFMIIPFLSGFLIFYSYPSVRIWERQRKIDAQLPYAIGWMSSLAGVGVIPYHIFKKLAEAEEYYGEVSREGRRLVRDVELLGFDFITALRNLAEITPSRRLGHRPMSDFHIGVCPTLLPAIGQTPIRN